MADTKNVHARNSFRNPPTPPPTPPVCGGCSATGCYQCGWEGIEPGELVEMGCMELEALFADAPCEFDTDTELERACDLAAAMLGKREGYYPATRSAEGVTIIMHYEFGGGIDPVAYATTRDGVVTMTHADAKAHAPLVAEFDANAYLTLDIEGGRR